MVNTDDRRGTSRQHEAISGLEAALVKRVTPTRAQSERGQTLMEFALVVPIILIFLLVVLDFGLAMDRRIVLQHAVREGAREGATGAGVDKIKEVTAEQVGISDLSQIDVCYVDADNDNQLGEVGEDVKVTANVVYHFATGTDVAAVFGITPEIPMSPSADMRVENRAPVAGAVKC